MEARIQPVSLKVEGQMVIAENIGMYTRARVRGGVCVRVRVRSSVCVL